MRFYDPDFGSVLLDGTDIKEYNVASLRQAMGLVMQEPTLFNYSVKENILYGKLLASNAEIKKAVQTSNAAEFIETKEIEHAFEDSAASLIEAIQSPSFKKRIIEKIGQKAYDDQLDVL